MTREKLEMLLKNNMINYKSEELDTRASIEGLMRRTNKSNVWRALADYKVTVNKTAAKAIVFPETTPVMETPVMGKVTEVAETPVMGTPVVEKVTEVAETLVMETPVVEEVTEVAETPVMGTPVVEEVTEESTTSRRRRK